jgi:hypothetical protein
MFLQSAGEGHGSLDKEIADSGNAQGAMLK